MRRPQFKKGELCLYRGHVAVVTAVDPHTHALSFPAGEHPRWNEAGIPPEQCERLK